MLIKKILYYIVAGLFVIGCAEPKYQNMIQPANSGSQQSNGHKVECVNVFAQNNLCMQWFFEDAAPVAQKYTTLIVKLYKLNIYDQSLVYMDPELDTKLKVTPWMPSMSHGTIPTQITKLDIGTYRITNVYFIMSGPWVIYFDLSLHEAVERVTVAVDIP